MNTNPDTNTIGSETSGVGEVGGEGGDVGAGDGVGGETGVSDGMAVGSGVGSGRLGNVRSKPVFMNGIPWGWYVSVWFAETSPRENEMVCPVRDASAATDSAAYFPSDTITGFDS